jgi:hypothetical protein
MGEEITKILNELWSSTNERSRILDSFIERMDDGPEEKKFWASYEDAVAQVSGVWGEPEYSGIGPRWGYKGPGPGSGIRDYGSAVRISWWRADKFVAVVMVTGHDADTLLFLTLAVLDIEENEHLTL